MVNGRNWIVQVICWKNFPLCRAVLNADRVFALFTSLGRPCQYLKHLFGRLLSAHLVLFSLGTKFGAVIDRRVHVYLVGGNSVSTPGGLRPFNDLKVSTQHFSFRAVHVQESTQCVILLNLQLFT